MQYSLLEKDDIPHAVDVMSEAFVIDPIVRYFTEDLRFPRVLYSILVPFYFKYGEVWINSERNAVLMCLTPESCNQSFNPSLFNLIEVNNKFGFKSLFRLLKHKSITTKYRPLIPHYYIFSVGTTNEARNKGYAGEILRFFMRRAEKEGAYLYGENTNPEMNTGLYTYLGFDHLDPVSLTETGPNFIPTFKDYTPSKSKTQ